MDKQTNDMALSLLTELRKDLSRIRDENHDLREETHKAMASARILMRHLEAILGANSEEARAEAEAEARQYLELLEQTGH